MPFGSPGVGSQMHLIGEMFNLNYGTKFQHVAYRGVAPAMQDLLGGHIPMVMGEMGSAKPLVTSGQLRALAVTGTKRNASVPDVPTFTEAGFPNFEVNSWFALFVPVATPKPIVDKIAADVTKIVRCARDQRAVRRRRLGGGRRHACGIHRNVAQDVERARRRHPATPHHSRMRDDHGRNA